MRVLLENTTFLLHKIVGIEGIIRVAGIIRGRALYEEIRYLKARILCAQVKIKRGLFSVLIRERRVNQNLKKKNVPKVLIYFLQENHSTRIRLVD